MKNQKGITLIALIITIIVILILASVTISSLFGQNGILTKVTTARDETTEEGAKEKLNLVLMDIATEKAIGEAYSKYITLDDIANKIKADIKDSQAEVKDTLIEVEIDGYIFEVDNLPQIVGTATLANITIKFMPNGDNEVNTIAKTKVQVTNNKSEVDSDTLKYQWSDTKVTAPTGTWKPFESDVTEMEQPIVGNEIWYLWVQANSKGGDASTLKTVVSKQFNQKDNITPALSAASVNTTTTQATVTATITTLGFSGIDKIKYLEGNKSIEDFNNGESGNELTMVTDKKIYTFTTSKNGQYTVYVKGKNEKQAISLPVTVSGLIYIPAVDWASLPEFNTTTNTNNPKGTKGMVPVKWDNSANWIAIENPKDDTTWFNYTAQTGATISGGTSNWANVCLSDGLVINGADKKVTTIRKYAGMDTKICI